MEIEPTNLCELCGNEDPILPMHRRNVEGERLIVCSDPFCLRHIERLNKAWDAALFPR